jgi:hypothetical protein
LFAGCADISGPLEFACREWLRRPMAAGSRNDPGAFTPGSPFRAVTRESVRPRTHVTAGDVPLPRPGGPAASTVPGWPVVISGKRRRGVTGHLPM